MSVALILALLDAAVGVYLIWYALKRERRDKPAVLVVGFFLLACFAALMWVALSGVDRLDEPGRLPAPAGDLARGRD